MTKESLDKPDTQLNGERDGDGKGGYARILQERERPVFGVGDDQ